MHRRASFEGRTTVTRPTAPLTRPPMLRHSLVVTAALALAVTACGESAEHRAADSVAAVEAAEQARLGQELAAQKDSLMTVVLEADKFFGEIDSSLARVKDLPRRSADRAEAEGVLAQQIEARKDMLFRVDALVKRAQVTARQLAESKRRVRGLEGENAALRDSLAKDERLIAELGATIARQVTQIGELEGSVAALTSANERLGEELRVSLASNAKVYYVIGREDDLVKQGLLVREGGMNLLVVRRGRTLQPARQLDPAAFTAIDAREVTRIAMPDTTKRYRIVSRHPLEAAEVRQRDKDWFRGDLRITNAQAFWAPSRYLIIVQG